MAGSHLPRRQFLARSAWGAALLATPGLYAEMLSLTPRQTEGPFYPDRLPLDTDNDLLRINDASTPADGEVTHLTGRVLSSAGEPIRNATVEIWQCDATGAYIHSGGSPDGERDPRFQGYGRFLTDLKGQYYFRTIKPVPYPGRTPHIHYAITVGGKRMLTTQCYIAGEPQNHQDGVFRRLSEEQQNLVLVDFSPIEQSMAGELTANFDLIIGETPEDRDATGDRPPRGPRPPQGRGFGPGRTRR